MLKPTIIIAGKPQWAEPIAAQLSPDYTVTRQTEPEGYMTALIESRAAMVLVDGDSEGWESWVNAPKASPATRRIPLVVVSEDATRRGEAPARGADLALSPDALLQDPGAFVQDNGRLPDPEHMKQLDCECQEELPELAQEGVRKFNAGEYYKQHDLFEEQWVNTEGPVRDLYRAVLQVGVAYYQIERGNYRGALKMLQRSVQWLVVLPDVCQGIDVRQLREDSFRVRAELERLGEDRFDEFDTSLIRGVELVTSGD